MKINKNLATNSSIVITIILILLTTISFFYQKEISVKIDSYYSSVNKYFRSFGNDFSIIKPNPNNKISPYKNLPAEFTHSGSLLFYKPTRNMHINDLAEKSIKYTQFYKLYNLKKSIKEINNISSNTIEANKSIYIPYSLPSYIENLKKHKKTKLKFTKGLYYTGNSIGNANTLKKIINYKNYGINSIVFDIKDITGIITYKSDLKIVNKLNTHKKRSIDNIYKLIRILKQNNIYSIARIAVFHDHLLAKIKPEWTIQSIKTGKSWSLGQKEIWCDPTNKYVQQYNIDIAIEIAKLGVDEIQFDYIRFPTAGNFSDAKFANHYGKMPKEQTISNFLQRAQQQLAKYKTNISIDIFGIVAWSYERDIKKIGQRIEYLAQYSDIISPMLYPSHFNDNFEGHANPGDSPYYFIFNGTKKVQQKSGTTFVRPWLQAFGWRVTNYNANYIIKQIKACYDVNAEGYLFWNASNNYDTVIEALKILNNNTQAAN